MVKKLEYQFLKIILSISLLFIFSFFNKVYADWQQVGANFSYGASDLRLTTFNGALFAVVEENKPIFAQRTSVEVWRLDGSSWTKIGSFGNSFSASSPVGRSLTSDANNLYVVIKDRLSAGLKVFKYDGANWQQIGPVFNQKGGGVGGFLIYNGQITVATTAQGPRIKPRIYSWDGSDWTIIGKDPELGTSSTNSMGGMDLMNAEGNLYLSGRNANGQATIYKYLGVNNWTVSATSSLIGPQAGQMTYLNGKIYTQIGAFTDEYFVATQSLLVGTSYAGSTATTKGLIACSDKIISAVVKRSKTFGGKNTVEVWQKSFDNPGFSQIGSSFGQSITWAGFNSIAAIDNELYAAVINTDGYASVFKYTLPFFCLSTPTPTIPD